MKLNTANHAFDKFESSPYSWIAVLYNSRTLAIVFHEFLLEQIQQELFVLPEQTLLFEPTIYRILCEHANHYTTDGVWACRSN